MTYRERRQTEFILGLVGLVIGLLIAAQADWHRFDFTGSRTAGDQRFEELPPRARITSGPPAWVLPEE